ncbi:LPXTG cell wall anchor domain-containing protein [Streptomyces sp. NPDC004327]|uniref:LPXTG cell wall anchor domain-containing protein n=1 Tax=Streptomyces sp. NPDC004327 TaxID=3364699 RepID=UPI00368635B7
MAAAVTTPVVLLSAAPAFADTKPATGAEQQAGKSVKELEIALAAAQAAYDKAVADYNAAQKAVDDYDKADNPLKVAAVAARKASDDAAAAKTAADTKLDEAKKAEAALPADATQEQKDKAAKDVADAQAAADTAKTDADAKAKAAADAQKAFDDGAVALFRKVGDATKARDAAKKAVDDAQKALDEAKKNLPGVCPDDKSLVTTLTGPKTITAGSSGIFTFRVTNKGNKAYDEVGGLAWAFRMDDYLDDSDDTDESDDAGMPVDPHLTLTWSSATSPKWQKVDPMEGFSGGVPLAAHKSVDFKLKVAYDAKTPAGEGAVFGIGLRVNKDNSCSMSKDAGYVDFTVVKPHKPGTGTGKGDGKGNGSNGGNGNTSQQGGSSNTPVTGGTSGTTGGTLAKTGAGSSTLPIGLAGGAAVVLGAGAMVVVRRRKAGADA